MSETNAEDITNVNEEKTKARDTSKFGSHFTQPPQSKYEDQESKDE